MTFSCNSFLDVNPEGTVIESEQFVDAQGFEDALYGVYATMASDDLYGKVLNFWMLDVFAQYYYQGYTSYAPYYFATLDHDSDYSEPIISGVWEDLYKTIGYANNILDNLDAFEDKESLGLYDIYYAEALAARAFLHFDLTRLFCDNIIYNSSATGIPYRDHYDFAITAFDDLSVTYEKIIADLEKAEELYGVNDYFDDMYDDTSFLRRRQMHFNLHAVRAILARVYWTMGNLEKAAFYALQVVNTERFELISDYSELTSSMAGIISEKEGVFGLFTEGACEWTYHCFYLNFSFPYTYDLCDYDDVYLSEGKLDVDIDYRYENWFYQPYSTSVETRVCCMKTVDIEDVLGSTHSDTAIEGINLIRLPEMYYMIAEYYIEQGDQASACLYFDKVLTTRGLTGYAARGTGLTLDDINIERRKEYISEGIYWYNMKRYNEDVVRLDGNGTFTASSDVYVLPLPSSEVDYRDDI